MRTGSVIVEGEAMNTVIVTSSKLWMKASAQPLATPGSINGRVTRRKTVKLEAHIDTDEGNACNLQANTPCELMK